MARGYFNNPGSTQTHVIEADAAHRAWWMFGTSSGRTRMFQAELTRSGRGMRRIHGVTPGTLAIVLLRFTLARSVRVVWIQICIQQRAEVRDSGLLTW